MSRRYQLTFENVAVSAVQDMVLIQGAAGKSTRIVRAWVGCTDQTPTNQQLAVRARFLPATVTAGTGGSVNQTPARTDPGDAACSSATCGLNNTGKATTTGTAIVLYENGVNIFAGDSKAWQPGKEPPIGPGEAFVWELIAAPAAAIHLSGGVEIDETGG